MIELDLIHAPVRLIKQQTHTYLPSLPTFVVIRYRADASVFPNFPAVQQDPLWIWPFSQADGRELAVHMLEHCPFALV